ncbi:hypothetical protein SPF06_02520 [Sinomonas sp. JGH33]|uniref:SMI1/KNR4 family protein n=1 Tax=Sinomonas terricola TaxID=3110330 RepID=A0ABU5T1P5_9MICC|nr:hypothetical protein [Sinomonas sp. JGH33]MEA5453587.1 hypothetical protein [Sinomonas sp. JGH33]
MTIDATSRPYARVRSDDPGPMPLADLRREVQRRQGIGIPVPAHWLSFLAAADSTSTSLPLTCMDATCSHDACTPEAAE